MAERHLQVRVSRSRDPKQEEFGACQSITADFRVVYAEGWSAARTMVLSQA